MQFMGAIHSNTIRLYNNKKNPEIYISKKTITLNPSPRFYQVKLENYGINVTPDKNSSCKLHTSQMHLTLNAVNH